MIRFDRFLGLIGMCLVAGCLVPTDEEADFKSINNQNNTPYKNPIGGQQSVPCNTEVKLTTSSGIVVVIYLDCFQEQKRGPVSDDPTWGNNSQGEIIIAPGWTKPPPPGDPYPW